MDLPRSKARDEIVEICASGRFRIGGDVGQKARRCQGSFIRAFFDLRVLFHEGIHLRLQLGDGNSRFDFYLERGKTLDRGGTIEQGGEKYLIEVKGCTLAGSKLGFGLFPDAPTERGVKHLNELAEAAGQGYHCAIVFVIQMNGIHHVDPNDATQPEFREALEHAVKAGVHVICQSCCVDADRIWICGAADDTARLKG